MNDNEMTLAPEQTGEMVGTADMLFGPGRYQTLKAFAVDMAKGTSTVPQHLQGKPADCLAVTMQAATWGMNPFAVAQKTHLVNGTLGYEAQLVNAVINTMAPTTGRIQFDWFGPWDEMLAVKPEARSAKETGCGVRVWAKIKGEDKPRELSLLMSQATVRNSPLWKSDPKQQLAYLAIKRWARLYTPDVILGVYTRDELEEAPSGPRDMGRAEVIRNEPAAAEEAQGPASRTSALKDKLRQNKPAKESEDVEDAEIAEDPLEDSLQSMIKALETVDFADFLPALKQKARDLYNSLDTGQKNRLTRAINAAEARFKEPEVPEVSPESPDAVFASFIKNAQALSSEEDAKVLMDEVKQAIEAGDINEAQAALIEKAAAAAADLPFV